MLLLLLPCFLPRCPRPVLGSRVAANTNGVFTLDQLRALGQTGDTVKDLTREGRTGYLSNIQALEAFRKKQAGVDAVRAGIPAGTKAGYYQVPGQQGAEYYDPATGNASEALAQYLTTGKDQFGAPPAPVSSGDTGEVHRASESQGLARRAGSIFDNARNQGISLQDATDQLNSTGKYQRAVMGTDGKLIDMKDVAGMNLHPDTGYTDLSASRAGAFERLSQGRTPEELSALLGAGAESDAALQAKADYFKTYKQPGTELNYAYEKAIAPGSPIMTTYTPEQLASMSDVGYWKELRDSLAANAEKTYQAQQGIRSNREARGLDPETGISANEKRRISDIYNRIQDPAQKSMFIKAQDPGNLTAAERVDQIAARGPEMARIAAENKQYDTGEMTHFYQGKYYAGEIHITSGAQLYTDPATGRSAYGGSSPYKLSYNAPKDSSGNLAARMGGAIGGGLFGYLSGGLQGAAAGAWFGAGGWGPNAKNIGLNKGGWGIGKGFSGGTWGKATPPSEGMMKAGVTSIMMSSMFSSASSYAKGISMRGPNTLGPTPPKYGMQF